MSGPYCPVPGCKRMRRGEMCREHWYRVSPSTRQAVWDTWRAWRADFADVERMLAYRAASEDALTEASS